MFINKGLDTDSNGILTYEGVRTTDLVEQYGTPLYVMSEKKIIENIKSFKSSIDKYYGGNGLVAYASKAFSCVSIYNICNEQGIGCDAVSIGELYTISKSSLPMEKVFFHGNNKTLDEIEFAVMHGVGYIVVDNLNELMLLNSVASIGAKKVKILLRIKPGIDAHTHDFIRTGQIDSKFGFALETGEAYDAAKQAITYSNLELVGVHCHIGSQIFDIDPFVLAAERLIEFIGKVRDELSHSMTVLNLGGGFGIKYLDEHDPEDSAKYMEKVSVAVHDKCKALSLDVPFIVIEPGRAVVGDAGITLYKVGGIKEIPNIRTYLSIDGGMTDNPRYALYKSDYSAVIANKATMQKDAVVTIAGKCCESGDLIQENTAIQSPEVGDILAVLSTGAYNYSMASNYNRITRAAVVFVSDGESRVVVKRETLDDLIKNDVY